MCFVFKGILGPGKVYISNLFAMSQGGGCHGKLSANSQYLRGERGSWRIVVLVWWQRIWAARGGVDR